MVPRSISDFPLGLLTQPGPPLGSTNPSRTSPRVPLPVLDITRVPRPCPDLPDDSWTRSETPQRTPTHPGPPRGSLVRSRTSLRVPRPVSYIRVGPPTRPRTSPRVPRPVPDLTEGPQTRLKLPQGSPVPSRTYSMVPHTVPDHPERCPAHLGPHGGFPDPSRTSSRVSQPVPDLPEGSQTCPIPI